MPEGVIGKATTPLAMTATRVAATSTAAASTGSTRSARPCGCSQISIQLRTGAGARSKKPPGVRRKGSKPPRLRRQELSSKRS